MPAPAWWRVASVPRSGVRVGRRAGAAATPTQQGWRDRARTAFQGAENSGVGFSPSPPLDLGRIRHAIMGPNPIMPRLRPGSHNNALRAFRRSMT